MQKIETYFGSAVWMAISFLMVFAALEPVEVRAHETRLADAATAAGADAAASVSLLCETNSL